MKPMAHVEKIVQVYSIEGADRVEMAQVLDWHVLVPKDQYKVGDLAVYVEVDSILPDGLPSEHLVKYNELKKEWKAIKDKDAKAEIKLKMDEVVKNNTISQFEFLRDKKFTIKIMHNAKLGIYSQGILFTIKDVDNVLTILGKTSEYKEGLDLTELLGIQKVVEDEAEEEQKETPTYLDKKLMRFKWYRNYKKKMKVSGKWLSIFPPQSDEENVQKLFSRIVSKHGRTGYVKTEKIEGNSFSFYKLTSKSFFFFSKTRYGVCSRRVHMPKYNGSDFWRVAKFLKLEEKMELVPGNIFIRGERVDTKVQGNIYGVKEPRLYIYDVWDMDTKKYYNFYDTKEFCERYGFDMVPVLDENYEIPETVQEIVDQSNGKSVLADTLKEGDVIRMKDNYNISFKVKSPIYQAKK